MLSQAGSDSSRLGRGCDVRKLGAAGPAVFPLALGCMGMSGMYGQSDERESLATIHAALDVGVIGGARRCSQ
jgi:hypothetical protein